MDACKNIGSNTAKDNMNKWMTALSADERDKLAIALNKQKSLRDNGATVYPPDVDIFRAFSYFPPEKTKVVIIGQDPYHNPEEAMGMSFSVRDGIRIPPSLQNIYKEIQTELGGYIPTSGDLTRWAEQGVLLLNASLTVEYKRPNSHQPIWAGVTDAFLRVCLTQNQPIVFMLWGAFAQRMFEENAPDDLQRKCVLLSTHPSPYSADRASSTAPAFLGCGHFAKANDFLESFGIEPIKWN